MEKIELSSAILVMIAAYEEKKGLDTCGTAFRLVISHIIILQTGISLNVDDVDPYSFLSYIYQNFQLRLSRVNGTNFSWFF